MDVLPPQTQIPSISESPEESVQEQQPNQEQPRQEQPIQQIIKQYQKIRIDEDKEFSNAKAYLSQQTEGQNSLYAHLTKLVARILEERPANALQLIEQMSTQIKAAKAGTDRNNTGQFKKIRQITEIIDAARNRIKILQNDEDLDDTEAGELPDIMDLANLFEWAGVSLDKSETFLLAVSLKRLTQSQHLRSIRLFGKIYGINASYYVVEAEADENSSPNEEFEENNEQNEEEESKAEEEEGEEQAEIAEDDPRFGLPGKGKAKKVPKYEAEIGTGINKYAYFVCSQVGGEWTRLPNVTPVQIQIARKIQNLCSGDLRAKINSYPTFPGVEAHYLRAQIARIAAATVVSPAGYYTVDEEGDAGAAEGHVANLVINPEYDGLATSALLDLANWVHHVPYVLPQGRTVWANPYGAQESEEEKTEEELEEEESAEPEEPLEGKEPEESKPPLAPLGDDEAAISSSPAWSTHLASTLLPQKFSPVFLRSLNWPGAVTVSFNDKFANIYIGNGLKAHSGHQLLAPLPKVWSEYQGDALVEGVDPTAEEEKAFEAMLKKKNGGGEQEDGEKDGDEEEEGDGEDAEEEEE